MRKKKRPKLMKCGHAPIATNDRGEWVCPICIGIDPEATVPEDSLPNLEGREAMCGCGYKKPSSFDLAFFEYHPESKYDSFYCGCRGWD